MSHRLYLRLDGGALQAGEFRDRTVCCPRCGQAADLPETHRVMRGGRVDLIWPCANQACPFADWLELAEVLE